MSNLNMTYIWGWDKSLVYERNQTTLLGVTYLSSNKDKKDKLIVITIFKLGIYITYDYI